MMPARQILFADDDVLTQWITSEVLSQAGFSVVSCCRGAEVVAILDASTEFDLLLMEAELPDHFDGRRLADRWASVLPGRPVIYSSRAREGSWHMLRQNEFFIAKPYGAARLLRLVDRALTDAILRPGRPEPLGCGPHVH